MPRECQFCDNHQMINMEENPPGSKYRWKVTNLDGSFHKHVKYGSQQQQQQPKQETVTITDTVAKPMVTKDEQYQIKQAVKEEAIATAHKENMEESEKLRASLNNLEQKIDDVGTQVYNLTKVLSGFSDIVRAYLDSVGQEQQQQPQQ